MFDWLYNLVYGNSSSISRAIRDLIHSAVHAVMGILSSLFGNIGGAWWNMVWGASAAIGNIGWFCNAVVNRIWRILYIEFPNVYNWAVGWINWLRKFVEQVLNLLYAEVSQIYNIIIGWINAVYRWVLQNIYYPLWGWVQQLYRWITDWAWYAYWYITHPDALAAILFWALFGVFARNAWTVAKYIGEWLLRVFLQNALYSFHLVEQIITDVL